MLTDLAQAKYDDGSTPEIIDVVRVATFLFAAGQETTVKLLSAGLRVIAERPDIQALLRGDRSRIQVFLEETLRTESPVKSHFRMARTTTTVGGVTVPAGTTVMLLPGASNRDPASSTNPTSSASTAPMCASMWRSGAGCTRVPARRWPAPRAGSR